MDVAKIQEALRLGREGITYDPEAHAYTDGTGPLPHVTGISGILDKPQLNAWKARLGAEAEAIGRESRDIGKGLHALAQGHLTGTIPADAVIPDESQELFPSWLAWWGSQPRVLVQCERLLWSRVHRFAGTPDLLWWDEEAKVLTITDTKTGNDGALYSQMAIQLGGYALAVEEHTGIQCRLEVVKIRRDGKPFRCARVKNYEAARAAFIACLALYRFDRSKVAELWGAA